MGHSSNCLPAPIHRIFGAAEPMVPPFIFAKTARQIEQGVGAASL
jgi:hypothetical protein